MPLLSSSPTYISDLPRRAPPPYHPNGDDLSAQTTAGDSQQEQTPQSYIPIYAPLDQPWQDVSLLAHTTYETGSFVTEHVPHLDTRRSTNTSVRSMSGYNLSSEMDQYPQVTRYSEWS